MLIKPVRRPAGHLGEQRIRRCEQGKDHHQQWNAHQQCPQDIGHLFAGEAPNGAQRLNRRAQIAEQAAHHPQETLPQHGGCPNGIHLHPRPAPHLNSHQQNEGQCVPQPEPRIGKQGEGQSQQAHGVQKKAVFPPGQHSGAAVPEQDAIPCRRQEGHPQAGQAPEQHLRAQDAHAPCQNQQRPIPPVHRKHPPGRRHGRRYRDSLFLLHLSHSLYLVRSHAAALSAKVPRTRAAALRAKACAVS